MDAQPKGNAAQSSSDAHPPSARPASLKRFWLGLSLLVLIAAAFRVAGLEEYLRLNPLSQCPQVDARVYWEMAGRMAAGEWTDGRPFLSAPLYPYLLGVVRWLGGGLVAVYVLQLLVYLATGVVIGFATRLRFGTGVALAAAILFFLLAEPAVSVQRVLASTVQIFLVAIVWWRWVIAAERGPRVGNVLLCGVAIGVYTLSQSAGILLVPLFGLWLLWIGGKAGARFLHAVLGVAAACVAISPATIHNYAASGEFIPVSANAGINLYLGNAPAARGIIATVPDIRPQRDWMFDDAARAFEQAEGRLGSWREIDSHYRRIAWRSLADHPGRALRLLATKAYYFLSARTYDDIMIPAVERSAGYAHRDWLAPLATPWIWGLALVGLVAALRRPVKFAPEWLLWLLPLLVVVLVFYTPRYRMPAIPVGCGLAIWALVHWRRGWAWRTAIIAAVALSISLEIVNRATGFDRLDLFENHFRRQLSEANLDAAELDLAAGDAQRAETRYGEALRLWSESGKANSRYARFLMEQERAGEAIPHLEATLSVNPAHLPSRLRLYDAYCITQRYADAKRVLMQLVTALPQRGDVKLALAWLLATCSDDTVRDGKQAVRYAESARATGGVAEWDVLDVLAAALAEAGELEQARAYADQAAAAAREAGCEEDEVVQRIRMRSVFYRTGKRWRASPRPLAKSNED